MTEQQPAGGVRTGDTGTTAAAGRGRRPQRALDLDVLDGHLGYFVRRLQVWIFHDFVRTLAEYDIRPAQYSVLVVIDANPGLSQASLADTLGIQRARLVRLLDGLEKRGLTRRSRLAADRRYHALSLTAGGRRALKRIKVLAARHEARVAAILGARNRNMLISILRGVGALGNSSAPRLSNGRS